MKAEPSTKQVGAKLSGTPRTDAKVRDDFLCNHSTIGGDGSIYVPSDYARQLERELNAMTEVAEELCAQRSINQSCNGRGAPCHCAACNAVARFTALKQAQEKKG